MLRGSAAVAVLVLLLHRGTCASEPRIVLDPPPGATQKPYAPADGQRVEVNPPPFIWVPAGKGSVYAVQWSASQDFTPASTHLADGLRRSVFVPREKLLPGDWFWRYGVRSGTETVFGRTRSFTVPKDARPFPFPVWDEVIPRVPQARPRLFFGGARLEQARAWARGELKPPIDDLCAACEREVGKPLVPEPGVRPQGDEYGPWAVNVMRTTRPPMDVMERCALAYLLTGNEQLGNEAKRRLLHFFSWDPEGTTSFFAYDEPPMWMMMRGSRAYDWTFHLFSPEERARVEANMRARAGQFYTRLQQLPFESRPYDSHAGRLPGFLGECALSFIHEWPEAREWLDYATLLYYTSYPAWGGDDGGWQEGPGYWGAYMQFALHYVVALRNATGVDLMQKPFFRNTPFYGLYTATPYHQHSPFGDGQTNGPMGLGSLMYAFSSLTQNPSFRWHAEACGATIGADTLSLATYDPALRAVPPRDVPQARAFPAVGLASFHTSLGEKDSDISFLMRSSPYGGVSHGHADQNAFVIEANGRGLAIATGYYPWYGSPHHVQWTRATRAVNSVLVNGEGQVQRRPEANGQLTAFETAGGYDYAEGEASPAYAGRLDRFRRHVVHVRPGVFVMFDDLRAPQPSQFQWLLHAYRQIEIDNDRRQLHVVNQPAEMTVFSLLPEELAYTQTDKYTPEPEPVARQWSNTWHLTASTVKPARHAQFLTVFAVHPRGENKAAVTAERIEGQGAVGVRLQSRDGADVIAFRTDDAPSEVVCGDTRFTGRVSAKGSNAQGRTTRELKIPRP
jgi:hypothetical protein